MGEVNASSDEVSTRSPFAPTLEGQHIIENLVIIGAAIGVGATVRSDRPTSEPKPEHA